MEYKVNKIKLSTEEVLQKMRNWCVYQERSQQEVRRKMSEFNLGQEEIEEIIASLITENYLNEERFVTAFCNGKLRIKHWGKHKIRSELRKHQIPEPMLHKVLNALNQDEYISVLQKVILKRINIKTESKKSLFFNTLRYCISRGFEQDVVNEHLKILLKINTLD